MQSAIETLRVAKAQCDNNAPINEAEGNIEQAALERQNSVEYAKAIEILQAA